MSHKEKAESALREMKEAIVGFESDHKDGVIASDVARELGLESDFEGSQRNYLSWSVLGLLVNENRLRYEKRGRNRIYFVA